MPKLWVFLRYEKLQNICFNYRILGHEQKDCQREKKMVVLDNESPRYGPRLGVSPAKSLAEIVAEKGCWFFVGQKMGSGRQCEGLGETTYSIMWSSNSKFRVDQPPEIGQRYNDGIGQKKTVTRQVEMTKEDTVDSLTSKVPSHIKGYAGQGCCYQLLHP